MPANPGKAASLVANEKTSTPTPSVPFSHVLRNLGHPPKPSVQPSYRGDAILRRGALDRLLYVSHGHDPHTGSPMWRVPHVDFSEHLKSIATPHVARPDTSALAAENRYQGKPAMDYERTFVAPSDRRELRQDVGRLSHSMFSKEGNLQTLAMTNSLVASGHMHPETAKRIHVDQHGHVFATGTAKEQAAALGLLSSRGGLTGIGQEILGTGPGFVMLGAQGIHHPLGTAESVAKGVGESVAGTLTHGRYGSKTNTALDDAANLWTLATLGAGAAGRVGELSASRAAMQAALSTGDRAALEHYTPAELHRLLPKGAATYLHDHGELPQVHPVAHALHSLKTLVRTPEQAPRQIAIGEGHIYAASSKNPLYAAIQRHVLDRHIEHVTQAGGHDIFAGVPGLRKLSAEARAARLGRDAMRVDKNVRGAAASRFELSPAQEHAAFIHSLGVSPQRYAEATQNAVEHADVLAERHGVPAERIRANHVAKAELTKLASQHLDEHGNITDPVLREAVAKMKEAGGAREALRGMTDEQVNHILGSRWFALEHMGRDITSEGPHAALTRLEAEHGTPGDLAHLDASLADTRQAIADHEAALQAPYTTTHKNQLHVELSQLRGIEQRLTAQRAAWARQDVIHEAFTKKGAELRERAFYLPTVLDSKRLRGASGSITRARGALGFGPPKATKEHQFRGKAFERGDYRTEAQELSQHAFSAAESLQSAKQLHQLLIHLSKATKEDAGTGAVPIRVSSAIPDDLRRMVYGNPHALQGFSEELWRHWQKGTAGQVRWVPEAVATEFTPHIRSKLGQNITRANQLRRGARFLNPSYGRWLAQNVAVELPQQGFLFPANVRRYFAVVKKLNPHTYDAIAKAMGEPGMAHSFTTPLDTRAVRGLGNAWAKVNDHIPRMLSFVHEARRSGFHSAADLERLMNDPNLEDARTQVIQRANRESLDYGQQQPWERNLQNVFATWPWMRASSVWTMRFLREHPLWAETALEAGRRGKDKVEEFYAQHGGVAPPSMEGFYPAHGGPIDTEVLNPGSTLAPILEAAGGLGHPSQTKYVSGAFMREASPALNAASDLFTGHDKYGNPPKSGSVFGMTLHDATAGIGPLQLAKAITGHGPAPSDLRDNGRTGAFEHWIGWPQEKANYDSLATLGSSIEKSSLRGIAQAKFATQQKLRQVAQLEQKATLPPGYADGFRRYWQKDGVLHATLAAAASKAGVHSDDFKKAEESLSFDKPDVYYLAVVRAAAKVSGHAEWVKEGTAVARQVMGRTDVTKQEKANALYRIAAHLWDAVNPPAVSHTYYAMLAHARIG